LVERYLGVVEVVGSNPAGPMGEQQSKRKIQSNSGMNESRQSTSDPVKNDKRAQKKGTVIRGLYKRGDVYWLKWGCNGHTYRESLKTTIESEAITRAMQIRTRPDLLTAGEWKAEVQAFIADKKDRRAFRAQSASVRERMLLICGEECGFSSPASMSAEGLQRWYDGHLRRGLAIDTANSYVAMASSFAAWLVAGGKIRSNPCKQVRRARGGNAARKTFLRRADVEAIVDAIDKRSVPETRLPNDELKFCLLCGFDSGLRTEEIIEARPEWFDLDAGLLHVAQTSTWMPKDREARTIPLTKRFAAFLADYGLRSPYMLRPDVVKGAARYRYDFRRPFTEHVHACGFPSTTRHDMRRTFASLLVSAGVSIYKVAKWLGDEIGTAQAHYGHLIPSDSDIDRR